MSYISFAKQSGFEYNKIYIVESLPDYSMIGLDDSSGYDGHTGKRLYEQVLLNNPDLSKDFPMEFVHIEGRKDWFEFIDRVIKEIKEQDARPLLHLEIHGVEHKGKKVEDLTPEMGCLALRNHEIISYAEFRDAVTSINKESECNLLLVMAVCFGVIPGLLAIKEFKEMPFYGIIGSLKRLDEDHLIRNFTAFYNSLFKTDNLDEAMKELRWSEPNDDNEYGFYTAFYFFLKTWEDYLSKEFNDEAIKKKRKEFIGEHKDRNISVKLDYMFKGWVMRDTEKEYQKRKRNYFFLDLYPENEERFHVPPTALDFKKLIEENRESKKLK